MSCTFEHGIFDSLLKSSGCPQYSNEEECKTIAPLLGRRRLLDGNHKMPVIHNMAISNKTQQITSTTFGKIGLISMQ